MYLKLMDKCQIEQFIHAFLFLGAGQICSGFGGFFTSLQVFIHFHCCCKLHQFAVILQQKGQSCAVKLITNTCICIWFF